MLQSDFSLLFQSGEARDRHFRGEDVPCISKSVIEELNLDWLLDLDADEMSYLFTQNAEVLSYRRECFEDLMRVNALGDALKKVFPILRDISELRRFDSENDASTQSYLYSITEIELYVSCIETLYSGLSEIRGELKSRAFISLADRIIELAASEYYRELNEKLRELTERVKDIKSITIGVNLDAELRPSDAGVLSINSESFKSGDVIDKILRMNFKKDEYTCIAPLVPYVKGQSDNQKLALSHALNTAINDVFKSSVRSWKKIVQSYVLENTDFLLSIMPEIRFLLHGASLMQELSDKGYGLCVPSLAKAEERAFDAKGLYNPVIALRLDEETVSNDISFDENGKIYVLTGPNRGGKSVITCAVGIAQAMVQLGLNAPADSLYLSAVDGIFTHFPDGAEDTIEKGRLGEECARLEAIFSQVSAASLVLLDESLCSTGSFEGSYIAGEVLAGFSRVGCRVLFSTHLHELAASVDEINARCLPDGGVAIDTLVAGMEEGRRSFKIMRARPDGKSYAKDIADKFGLSYEQISKKINDKNI